MKNRVAIMTWYTYKNFGTALQACALYHCVEQMGYQPSIIQYRPKQRLAERQTKLAYAAEKLHNLPRIRYQKPYISRERDELFDSFLDSHITETEPCRTYPELCALNGKYDAFICGSDQIWSPLGYDGNYYLSFVKNTDKMIAYAPSMGVNKIGSPVLEEHIRNNIERFKLLSIREKQGAEIIMGLTGRDADVVLDPTLLMNSEQWDSFAGVEQAPRLPEEEYILCYFLGDSEKYTKYVERLSAMLGMKVYLIPITTSQATRRHTIPFEVGPGEFVSLIRNAKYICTDSFHGAAFAVNYNVPFTVFKRFSDNDPKSQNSRLESFLGLLGLEKRLVDSRDIANADEQLKCDFSYANIRLTEKRQYSENFLKNSLNSAAKAEEPDYENQYAIADLCCGCGACAAVCTQNAIGMALDGEGFWHSTMDATKCIRCDRCKEVCPMQLVTARDMRDALSLCSGRSKSKETLSRSSSGGVGFELARVCQKEGRFVCGVIYDDAENKAKHRVIAPEEADKLHLLQGSKYIQSDAAEGMEQTAVLSLNEKGVFFGTPCQAASVDKLLRTVGSRENIILVEVVCHGVPTYHLWEKYLSTLDREYKTGEHPSVFFRCSVADWHKRMMRVEGASNSYQKNDRQDDFYAFFRRGLCNMKSCYECPYRERSAADLRIGDFWGADFAREKQGVSMVIVNTPKGKELLEKTKNCDYTERDISEYWSVQWPYNVASPVFREELIEKLKDDSRDLHEIRKEYCGFYDFSEKCQSIKGVIKRFLKRG